MNDYFTSGTVFRPSRPTSNWVIKARLIYVKIAHPKTCVTNLRKGRKYSSSLKWHHHTVLFLQWICVCEFWVAFVYTYVAHCAEYYLVFVGNQSLITPQNWFRTRDENLTFCPPKKAMGITRGIQDEKGEDVTLRSVPQLYALVGFKTN